METYILKKQFFFGATIFAGTWALWVYKIYIPFHVTFLGGNINIFYCACIEGDFTVIWSGENTLLLVDLSIFYYVLRSNRKLLALGIQYFTNTKKYI